MALENPYCTLLELIDYLKLPYQATLADPHKTAELERAINAASRWVDAYTGKSFYEQDYSVVPVPIDNHDGLIFGNTLYVSIGGFLQHVQSISGLAEGTTVLAAGSEYVNKGDYIARVGTTWANGLYPNTISFMGVTGYPQATDADVPEGLPPMITQCTILVAGAFSGHNRKEISGLDGQATSILSNEIPKTVFQILGRGRIII